MSENTSQYNDDGSEEYNFTSSNGIKVRQTILKDRTKFIEFTEHGIMINSNSDTARAAMQEFINWKYN